MKRILIKLHQDKRGQSLVELALILPILILLLTLPVDFFRYINTKMILSSAASESIGQLNYTAACASTIKNDLRDFAKTNYGDRLISSDITVDYNTKNPSNALSAQVKYDSYVYSSEYATEPFYQDQFEVRGSNFQSMQVDVKFTYDLKPITFWGVLFLGDTIKVNTPVYTRNVYATGYTT